MHAEAFETTHSEFEACAYITAGEQKMIIFFSIYLDDKYNPCPSGSIPRPPAAARSAFKPVRPCGIKED